MNLKIFPVGMLETNCYIAWAPAAGAAFIVDPGSAPDRVLDFVRSEGLMPEAILLTHGHFDHILGVETWLAAYPEIRIFAGRKEEALLADPNLNMTATFRRRAGKIVPDVLLDDGEEFFAAGIQLKYLHTPGHTSGSGCYYYAGDDGSGPILFSGDTLFRGSCGRTDFETGSMEDMLVSLGKLSGLADETRVLPGHGMESDMAREKEHNPYMAKN